MEATRRIVYEDIAAGRRIVALPVEAPFASCGKELESITGAPRWRDELVRLAEGTNLYEVAGRLSSRLVIAEHPHLELLRILALALAGEPAAVRLLYCALIAVPPTPVLVGRLAGFTSLRRVMERIARTRQLGAPPGESEEWFSKKVTFLSLSKPLPGNAAVDAERPWSAWSEGVARALADPDDRWEEAVLERIRVEIEAADMRVRSIAAGIDPQRRPALVARLQALGEENRWMAAALRENAAAKGGSPLVLQRNLENIWESVIGALGESGPGALLVQMFEAQALKTHSAPQLMAGAAVIRGVLTHPELQRGGKKPDIPSCLHLFIGHGGGGLIEILAPRGAKLEAVRGTTGFSFDDQLMRIDLSRIPRGAFLDGDGMPVNIDWTLQTLDHSNNYRALVMSYMDNDSFLVALLNNPKAASKPGVVSLIATRCRSLRVLSLLTGRREYFTGHANKDVPLSLLMNPAKIPMTGLRKFIHVRYVDKMTLQKLSARGGGQVREEVRREIARYLSSIH